MTRTKKPKALWTAAFPAQAKALRPENTPAGGVKARSASEEARMAVYRAINLLFAATHPYCECCSVIWPTQKRQHPREETHHARGRDGMLLFDVRYFKSTCRPAHAWIHDNEQEAAKLGLIIS